MAYERINWQNGEVGNTPLNANNLNRMDMTLEEHDQKIGDHDYEIENLKTGEQGITEELNKKMDRINPQGSGTLSIPAVNADNITAQTVEADEIKVAKVGSKGGTAPVVFDNDILVNGITTPIGSLASSASAKAESASERAEDAYNLASRANREAASAINLANDNKVKIDLHTGLIGEGVGDKWAILGYTDGYYIAPNGSVTQYNATATLIQIDFLDFLFRGDNIIFNHVDLLPTENCIPCAWFDISGNFISAADGLNIIAEFDEQTFKITKQYIDSCIIPVPAGASSCKLSGLANGRADIRIQTSLSEAIKELQSKPEPATLVLTNPSPLSATDGKKILGIDALGKSWQKTTIETVQGTFDVASGSPINASVSTSSSRCTSEVIQLASGTTVTFTDGYRIYPVIATSESGNISGVYGWKTSAFTTDANGYYRFVIEKVGGGAITPSSFNLAKLPSPTNPIPIIDASGDVSALDDRILTSEISVGKNWSGSTDSTCTTAVFSVVEGKTYIFDVANALPDVTQIRCVWREENSGSSYITYKNIDTNMPIIAPVNAKICALQFKASASPSADVVRKVRVYKQSNTITLPFEPKSVSTAANEFIVYEDGTGKIIQRIFEYRLPSSNAWALLETKTNTLRFVIANVVSAVNTESMCDYFKSTTQVGMGKMDEPCICVRDDLKGVAVMIDKTTASTKDAFLSWLANNEVILRYCATPIEKTLTAEEVAAVLQLMTYKGTTTIESEMDVKSVTYSGDVKAYVDGFHTYSTVPTICGYEEDGTPRYIVKIYTTTPSTADQYVTVSSVIKSDNANIKDVKGCVSLASGAFIPCNFYSSPTNYVNCFVATSGVMMSANGYTNRPCEITVEYTLKDSALAAASVLSLDETEE